MPELKDSESNTIRTQPTNVGRALLFWACQSAVCLSVVSLTQSFLIRFLPNFIYELLLSTSRSCLNTGFV